MGVAGSERSNEELVDSEIDKLRARSMSSLNRSSSGLSVLLLLHAGGGVSGRALVLGPGSPDDVERVLDFFEARARSISRLAASINTPRRSSSFSFVFAAINRRRTWDRCSKVLCRASSWPWLIRTTRRLLSASLDPRRRSWRYAPFNGRLTKPNPPARGLNAKSNTASAVRTKSFSVMSAVTHGSWRCP